MINRILITCLLVVLIAVVWFVGTALEQATLEARDVAHQAKLLAMSTRGLTFDVRKNLTSNVELQARTVDSLTGSMERMSTAAAASMSRAAARLERLADTLEGAACTTAAAADQALAETVATVRAVRADLVPASVAVLDGAARTVEQARDELAATGAEMRQAVAGVRPLLDATTGLIGTVDGIAAQGEKIAESGANVAAHYEKMIVHPTLSQRAKGLLQLFLSGFTVWGNAKTIF